MKTDAYHTKDDSRLEAFLRQELALPGLTLRQLNIACISRVYRADIQGHSPLFVKWGSERAAGSKAAAFIRRYNGNPLLPRFVHDKALELDGNPVYCFDWCTMSHLRIHEMSPAQFESFVQSYGTLSSLMNQFGKAQLPNDGDEWMRILQNYTAEHRLAKLFLKPLLRLRPEEYRHSQDATTIVHGDFHSGNFGFDGDRLIQFLDFDNFALGYPITDFAFAFSESIRACQKFGHSSARKRCLTYFAQTIQHFNRPSSEWRIAFNIIRLMVAAKTVLRHPHHVRIVFSIIARDRRICRLIKELPSSH